MDDSRDTDIGLLLASVRPRWDAERAERNLAATIARLRGSPRWRRPGRGMFSARLKLNRAVR